MKTMGGTTRILFADDHQIVREGLSRLIGREDGLMIVAEAENGLEAVRLAQELHPDLAILDLRMPVMDGAAAAKEILGADPTAKILLLTSFATAAEVKVALDAGVLGAVVKDSSSETLIEAIRATARGEKFVSWRRLALPDIRDVRDESAGLSVSRRFFRPEGEPADLGALRCGELLIVELAITADDTRTLSDLVVEDLFAGAFEPVHGALPEFFAVKRGGTNEVPASAWVMRSDARDDRMLVFSKKFTLERGHEAKFRYQVRVVSAGEFVLPGPSVEGMYHPALRARRIPGRIVVRH